MASAQGYADQLAPYDNKGSLGLRDAPDCALALLHKSRHLAERLRKARHAVVHTGAGVSTSAGIADFRGPKGVWTLENQPQSQSRPRKRARTKSTHDGNDAAANGVQRATSSFENAMPTLTHAVLKALHDAGHVKYVISQNVDNLHLRSGLPRDALSELHGNLFMEWCAACNRETPRDSEVPSVGLKPTGGRCAVCDGVLTDKALDWEDALPEPDFERAQMHAARADLHIVAGTSCQMEPARGLPFRTSASAPGAQDEAKAMKRDRVLVNMSRTDFDQRFGMVVRGETDVVFAVVAQSLGLSVRRAARVVTMAFDAAELGGVTRGVSCSARRWWNGAWGCANVPSVADVMYRPAGSDTDAGMGWVRGEGDAYCAEVRECSEVVVRVHVQVDDDLAGVSDDVSIESEATERKLGVRDAAVGATNVIESGNEKMEITIMVRRYAERVDKLFESLRERVREEGMYPVGCRRDNGEDEGEDEAWMQMMICGKKRGYWQCVLCGRQVWSGGDSRRKHVHKCVYDKMLTVCNLPPKRAGETKQPAL